MQKQLKTFFKKNEFNLVLLAFSSAIFLLRSNIPYAIYVFAVLQSLIFIIAVKKNGFIKLFNILKQTTYSFYAYYLTIFFFILGFVIKTGATEVTKDLLNLVILLSFIILLSLEINSLNRFNKFKETFLISFVILFSAYLLINFIISIFNNDLSNFFFAIKSAESFDRNMYSLNLWISIIGIFVFVKNAKKKVWIFLADIFLFLLLFLVLFSSSRRGIIIFSLFSFAFIIYQIFGYLKKTGIYRKLSTLFFLYLSMLLIILIIVFIPGKLRNHIFDATINNQELKKEITSTAERYYRLINPGISYKEYQLILWGTNLNPKTNQENNIDYKQLLRSAAQKYKESDYTQSINLIQKAGNKTDSIEQFFNLLPEEIRKELPVEDKEIIQYLPELVKFPYIYTKFFSCINIKNMFLENYHADTIDFPFVFSFKKDNARINLTLPALTQSEYELNFKIKTKKNPVDKIVIIESKDSKIKFIENKSRKLDTISYNYKISILDNKKVNLNLSIFLKNNNIDSFALSDISWKLCHTNNNETSENIYKRAKVELKKFKSEQNRSKRLWNYYFNAEKLVNINGQKFYKKDSLLLLFSLLEQKDLITSSYRGITIINKKNNFNILTDSITALPRARVRIPLIQKSIFKFSFEFIDNNHNPIELLINRNPEIFNILIRSQIIRDTSIQINSSLYRRIITFKIDTINGAQGSIILGFKNLGITDTIELNNVNFTLLNIEKDSMLLSDAQYSYLKNWTEKGKQDDEIVGLKKEAKQFENKVYWQIDSAVYESAAADRLELWLFGWQYFKSLPLVKKIFGDGFNYYHVYKLKFGSKYGYENSYFPHNPIISALLYSGILGALAYIFFLSQLFYYYIKNRKEMGVFLILFVLIFIYSFVSGKTHFTITYFVLFSIFPFLINFIKRSEKLNKKLNA